MSTDYPSQTQWTWAMMEPQPTEKEKALRDQFVDEYLIDYDPLSAALRCGFSQAFASNYAKQFMSESYVQKRIKEVEGMDLSADEIERFDKKRIRNGLMREAHNLYSPAAARVAALTALARINGLDGKVKSEEEVEKRGVMVVPGIASLEEWEREAVASQAKLSEDARSDIA